MKLLITGAWRANEAQISAIRELGHEVILMPDERGELPCAAEDIEGIICNGLFLYHPIEAFTKLSYIQLTSAGYDRVPMDIVKSRGITMPLIGMDLAASGTIPAAAGLSSSSSIVVAVMEAVVALNCLNITDKTFIDLCGEGGCRDRAVQTRGMPPRFPAAPPRTSAPLRAPGTNERTSA